MRVTQLDGHVEAAPSGAAPARQNRPKPARDEVMCVYRILFRAEEPLTAPQIAELMPRTGFNSTAMTAYSEHMERISPGWEEAAGVTWPDRLKKTAMVWWVRKIIHAGRASHFFETVTKTKARSSNPDREGTYKIGKRIPHVVVVRTVQEQRLVPWSPEVDEQNNGGHVAGMQFLSKLKTFRASGKKFTPDFLELLELAEKAIRK